MTLALRVDVPGDEIARFCRRHHIRKLSLFGSVLRDDFTAHSESSPKPSPSMSLRSDEHALRDTIELAREGALCSPPSDLNRVLARHTPRSEASVVK
jgi:hypothetical protein